MFIIDPYRFSSGPAPVSDTDAETYLQAVEAADGQTLETATRDAVNTFVVGLKADSLWSLIDVACIMMGARTLAGCLVPLKGNAPTNNGFVSGDYNRKTGIVGGASKTLAHNYTIPAGRQNNVHAAAYASTAVTTTDRRYLAVYTNSPFIDLYYPGSGTSWFAPCCLGTAQNSAASRNGTAAGLKGVSRSASTSFTLRSGQTNYSISQNSVAYSSTTGGSLFDANNMNGRLQWYSFGQALTLSTLETRLATLVSSIAAAF